MAKISIDAMGGDHAPQSIIDGVMLALKEPGFSHEMLLVGDSLTIKALLSKAGDPKGVECIHAPNVFGMNEKPAMILRNKESSLYIAARLVQEGRAEALVSAGNTGGLLTVATFVVGRLPNIPRPAIATLIPSKIGWTILLDSGANTQCKAEHFLGFARLGLAYAKMNGTEKPKMGLLNVGTEEEKGLEELHKASLLLKEHFPDAYTGYVEGRDINLGNVHIVVTDGFTGNVVLKTLEGLAKFILSGMKESIMQGGIGAKIGGMLIKPAMKDFRERLDYRQTGGAYIMGTKAPVVKAHGSSDAEAIKNALLVAARGIDKELTAQCEGSINP